MSNQRRAETGPMQFGDDWNGYFIRGDNMAGLRVNAKVVFDAIANGREPPPIALLRLRSFFLGPHEGEIQKMRAFDECVAPEAAKS